CPCAYRRRHSVHVGFMCIPQAARPVPTVLRLWSSHSLHYSLDILRYGLVAHYVVTRGRRGLMSGHSRGLVIEYNVENVLAFLDRVRDRGYSTPEERGITHQCVLLVRNELIH